MTSRAQQLYKGTPSVKILVLEKGTAFAEEDVYIKPPSANARRVWFEKMTSVADKEEKGDEAAAVFEFSALATDLILITNCDEFGKPFFVNADRDFLEGKVEKEDDPIFDQGYYDKLVHEAAKMLKLSEKMTGYLLLDVGSINFDNDDNEDEDEKGPGKSENIVSPEDQVSGNQTTQPNPQE